MIWFCQVLVDIKDKPDAIIGSKTWIGSTEVGYVLDAYINVSTVVDTDFLSMQ